ncbi:MDR family MFS transporter [Clostridium sp. ZS2-4]|uniref:MDR family MFS transporter n=1 Tax=Clostridium sp. ZS2-4 TaxID=2987703 RepID=UPI00227CECD9|nr:MFS transporter [Clostridium sp. ZS2-4]MCY6356283.1 MFS transporter [Clostridium sp. ZS2-4]
MKLTETFKSYSKLPRSIIVLFFARIINCLGNFIYPFLTMFLTEKMGMSTDKVGAFMMISAIAFVPGSIIGGKLCDHVGRKKVLIIFQLFAAIMLIPCGVLGNSMIVPWLLILSNFFGGAVQPASSAMLADLTNEENRQEAFSLLYLGTNIGVAVGPLIAGFLYNKYLKWMFWGDALTTIASLVLVAMFVKETIPSNNDQADEEIVNEKEKSVEGSLISVIFNRPALLAFSLVSAIYSFVYAQHFFCIPLQAKEMFGKRGPVIFGTVMSVNALVVVFCTVLIIRLTRKNRPILNIAMSGVFYAIGFGMLFFIKSYFLLIVSTVIWTIGEILDATNKGIYIANHTPMSHRGRMNSILPIISGAGFAVGPRIMGQYIKYRGTRSAWPLIVALALGASILMYVLYLKEKKYDIARKINIEQKINI